MKQSEYLSTILGPKYKLGTFEIDVLAAALAEVYRTGFRMQLDGAPLLWDLGIATEDDVYEVVRHGSPYWGLLSRLGQNRDPVGVYRDLYMFMTRDDVPSDLRRVAMVLLTEWSEGKVLEERSRQISPSEDQGPAREALPDRAGVEDLAYNGWLATGQFPLQVQGEHEGETDTHMIDLDQPLEGEDVPANLQLARLLRATWSAEGGCVDPHRLEAMLNLITALFMGERRIFEERLRAATENKPEPASLWPKDQDHWIYDQQTAVASPGLKIPAHHTFRAALEGAVSGAARFAVARASGMGTSRVFNIEGFVNGVVLGLLGDGQDDETFDIAKVFGAPETDLGKNPVQ